MGRRERIAQKIVVRLVKRGVWTDVEARQFMRHVMDTADDAGVTLGETGASRGGHHRDTSNAGSIPATSTEADG